MCAGSMLTSQYYVRVLLRVVAVKEIAGYIIGL